MKNLARFAAAAALTLALPLPLHAGGTYYPYQTYDDYYKKHSVDAPPPQPAPPPPAPLPETPASRPQQPIILREPPEFLFPPGLGFGVAVAVPYELFYLPKEYYLLTGGTWYRARSWQGPWLATPAGHLPPEIRKQSLSKIHELRNKEFKKYWKDKEHYQGKRYRPGEETRIPTRHEKEREKK
ncbi:hypothetical protein GMSM_38960 [Geomonas sp. Red276]